MTLIVFKIIIHRHKLYRCLINSIIENKREIYFYENDLGDLYIEDFLSENN